VADAGLENDVVCAIQTEVMIGGFWCMCIYMMFPLVDAYRGPTARAAAKETPTGFCAGLLLGFIISKLGKQMWG
jgi:hypothetical protein